MLQAQNLVASRLATSDSDLNDLDLAAVSTKRDLTLLRRNASNALAASSARDDAEC